MKVIGLWIRIKGREKDWMSAHHTWNGDGMFSGSLLNCVNSIIDLRNNRQCCKLFTCICMSHTTNSHNQNNNNNTHATQNVWPYHVTMRSLRCVRRFLSVPLPSFCRNDMRNKLARLSFENANKYDYSMIRIFHFTFKKTHFFFHFLMLSLSFFVSVFWFFIWPIQKGNKLVEILNLIRWH